MSVDQYQRAVNGLDKEIAVQLKELFTPEVTEKTIS